MHLHSFYNSELTKPMQWVQYPQPGPAHKGSFTESILILKNIKNFPVSHANQSIPMRTVPGSELRSEESFDAAVRTSTCLFWSC